MAGVLDGIRVLDFGRFIAGPFAATILGDLGADVIRIERIDGGEDRWTTPVTSDGQGALFLQVGRNKRSVTLNPMKPAGREIMNALIGTADVVVANLPPDTRRQMGLDYESLKAIKDDVIVSTVTCFGSGGPFSDRVGFDGLAQAMSGAMHMTGPEGQPTRNSTPYVDFCTGSLLAMATLAALRHRDLTGEGQELEGALLKTAVTIANATLIEQDQLQINREASHNQGQTAAPSDTFATLDGLVLVSVIGNYQFARWAKLVGRPELADDPRFQNDEGRGNHRNEICGVMSDWCADKSTDDVLSALADLKIPGAPVLKPQETLDHPHVEALGFLERLSYPTAIKDVPISQFPVSMTGSPGTIRHRSPELGEHTDEVLTELGFSSSEIDDFRSDRIV
ncbi:MAG: formyl-CoA transferase [Acidimicrobiaceae bacterium]|jgi:crotonobetainyl-CoA:carnitine CoA-transferase CaiB-like acyl-CoA transferase|nr:formyl-CoA transferase [Acidimicrobiaceae bacterium]